MEKQHNKNNISPKLSPITYWKGITKALSIARPIAFVLLGVLAFSACSSNDPNSVVADNSNATDIGDGIVKTSDGMGGTAGDEFVSKWTTAATAESITLPLVSVDDGGEYDFTVDWGDGTTETVNATTLNIADDTTAPDVTHTYATAGTFEVKITGTITGWQFGYGGIDVLKLVEISSFGPLDFGPTDGLQFFGAENLEVTATDAPGLTSTTSLQGAFRRATFFNANISSWDVSSVENMHNMFKAALAFNNGGQALNWGSGVSKVTNMSYMFEFANAFNADISSWNVSSVENMQSMFANAAAFNNGGQALNWGSGVSKVANMSYMFEFATAFNANISSWNVSSVENMTRMFIGATAFNNGGQVLSWGSGVSKVTTMEEMFRDATDFNVDISSWNISGVTDMSYMFLNASAFNNGGVRLTWTLPVNVICSSMFTGSLIASTANKPLANGNGCPQ